MTAAEGCTGCGGPLKPSAAFCAACGRAVVASPPAERGTLFRAIWLYVGLLAVQLVLMIYTRVTDDTFTAEVGGTLLWAAVAVAFYLPMRAQLASASNSFGLAWPWVFGILGGSVVIAALVIGYVHGLSSLFDIHAPNELAELQKHPWPWSILLIVIVPPLTEELAFRGVIYGGLRQSLSVGESLIVSSFAFAMIHLSFPALLTHLPLGLYFGWLRHRSGSLWPGVMAHACHNAIVVALAWWT